MTITNDYITTAEVAYLAAGVLAPTIRDKGEVKLLEQFDTVFLNMARAKASGGRNSTEQLGGGGIRYYVDPPRNQRIEWWDGTQKLTFQGDVGTIPLDFYLGKGHLGDMVPLELLERFGFKLRYDETIREGAVPAKAAEVVVNYIKANAKKKLVAWNLDLAIRMMTSNTDAAKCFLGFMDLFPNTTNSTGTIGGKSRAGNPLLRHQLMTGVTADTVEVAFTQMERVISDASAMDGTKTGLIIMGDNFFDMVHDLYKGTTTRAGKYNIQVMYDQAAKMSQQFKLGLPSDAFVGPGGAVCTRDPVWRQIDQRVNLTKALGDSCLWTNFEHFEMVSEKDMEDVKHPIPYDQVVAFQSLFGSYLLGSDKPGTIGWMTK